MPIKVACKCGQTFNAKDQLAGKTVRCPKCKNPLTIPGGAKAAPQSPAPQPQNDLGSLLDEAMGQPVNDNECPECGRTLPTNSVVCLGCGYNRSTGTKMSTTGVEENIAEASSAEQLVRKAAKEIAINPIETSNVNYGDISNLGAWILPFFMPVFFALAVVLVIYWGYKGYQNWLIVQEAVFESGKYSYCLPFLCFVIGLVCMLVGWYGTSMRALELNVWIGMIILVFLGLLGIPFAIYDWKDSAAAAKTIAVGWWFLFLGYALMNHINMLFAWDQLPEGVVTRAPLITILFGYMLLVTVIVSSIGFMWLSVEAFVESKLQGFLTYTGIYGLIYGYMNYRRCLTPAIVASVGVGIGAITFLMLIIGLLSSSYVFLPRFTTPRYKKDSEITAVPERLPNNQVSIESASERNAAPESRVSVNLQTPNTSRGEFQTVAGRVAKVERDIPSWPVDLRLNCNAGGC